MEPQRHGRDALLSYQTLITDKLQPLYEQKKKELELAQCDVDSIMQLGLELSVLDASKEQSPSPVKMLYDIGSGYRLQAHVSSASPVCVSVGSIARGRSDEQNIFLEMSVKEARSFVAEKLMQLQRLAQKAEDDCLRVTADLRSAQIALSALTQSSPPVP